MDDTPNYFDGQENDGLLLGIWQSPGWGSLLIG